MLNLFPLVVTMNGRYLSLRTLWGPLVGALLCGVLLTASPLSAAQMPEEVFPELRGLLGSALEESPRLAVQEWRIAEAEGMRTAAGSATMPKVTFFSTARLRYEDRASGLENDTEGDVYADLTVRYPLYHFGRNMATRRIGELRVEGAESDEDRLAHELLADVRASYLQVVLASKGRQLHEENRELALRLVDNREQLLRSGATTAEQLLEAEIFLQEAEANLAGAVNYLSGQRAYLGMLTGVPEETIAADLDPMLPDVRAIDENELARLRARADNVPADHPALLALEAQRDIREKEYEIAGKGDLPRLDAVGGVFVDQEDVFRNNEIDQEERFNYFIGLQMSWDIWDGNRTRGEQAAALARMRQVEAQLAETRDRLARENRRLLRDLEFNRRQMLSRDSRLELLNRRLALREEQEQRGEVSPNDVLRERIQLTSIQYQALQARIDYLTALARLYGNLGEDPFLSR